MKLTDEQKMKIITALHKIAKECDVVDYGLPVECESEVVTMKQAIDDAIPDRDMIDRLTEAGAKDMLREIIEHLDGLDTEDFFGTEGWRHRFGLED